MSCILVQEGFGNFQGAAEQDVLRYGPLASEALRTQAEVQATLKLLGESFGIVFKELEEPRDAHEEDDEFTFRGAAMSFHNKKKI